MTSGNKPDKVEHRDTSCFTYEVKMVIQVLAGDREEADQKLEVDGGYITEREVYFRDAVSLYSGEHEETAPKVVIQRND